MKFLITRTSERSVKGFTKNILETKGYDPNGVGIIEFDKIEELMKFLQKNNRNAVLHPAGAVELLNGDELEMPMIEIYDDYRE